MLRESHGSVWKIGLEWGGIASKFVLIFFFFFGVGAEDVEKGAERRTHPLVWGRYRRLVFLLVRQRPGRGGLVGVERKGKKREGTCVFLESLI